MTGEMSLRERKKLATRLALSRAALRLAVEHGLDSLTPEAIAEAADVSPRTFRNYFSSKEEAIVAELQQRVTDIADALRSRPADEPIWQSLRAVVGTVIEPPRQEEHQIVAFMRLVKDNPALLAQHLTVFEAMHQQLVELIAERTGTDARRDLYPGLLAAVSASCFKTALDMWSEGCSDATLSDLIDDAFDQVSHGLPVP
ncbi:TetR/AcrR family transcriptional regulator [Micromonospora sp. NPDC049679]|uniref:TetR/AcrR family transcriptional regulator n=1 Tax=Micromonospora sp. NPDC049679 TaxID=3155920 RepID=UPI00340A95C4